MEKASPGVGLKQLNSFSAVLVDSCRSDVYNHRVLSRPLELFPILDYDLLNRITRDYLDLRNRNRCTR